MSYDLYAELGGDAEDDVDTIVKGDHRGMIITDVFERIRLLAGVAAREESVKDYAVSGERGLVGGYKSLVHAAKPNNTAYAKQLVAPALEQLARLGISPIAPDLQHFPSGSWLLQFTFTLTKPWMSKDDDPFYVAESVNPVRKDKVFKVPMMSAASWKGLLRWTIMHIHLALKKDSLNDEEFAQERLRQNLLFGDEKGEEPGQVKDFAAYLDSLKPTARQKYEGFLRTYYNLKEEISLPHHVGRLRFYPTFFDLIDMEVINPHSRKTKAGTHPIYLECVPAGATGTFTLFYIPSDLIGQPEEEVKKQAAEDLRRVTEAVSAMMLTYGFSAKRTSGYGTASDVVKSGQIIHKIPGIVFLQGDIPQTKKPEEVFLKYLDETGRIKPSFKGSGNGGLLSNPEYKKTGVQAGGGSFNEFKRFRTWYVKYGKGWQASLQHSTTQTDHLVIAFESLSKLVGLCQNIKSNTTNGGAA